MSDYLIVGLAVAGIELIYQKLMFPGNPLSFWFQILLKLRYNKWRNNFLSNISKIIGYCHMCNSVWLAMIAHIIAFGLSWFIFITMGVTFVILSALIETKYLIHVQEGAGYPAVKK